MWQLGVTGAPWLLLLRPSRWRCSTTAFFARPPPGRPRACAPARLYARTPLSVPPASPSRYARVFAWHPLSCFQALLFLLDINGFQLNADSPKRSAADALRLLCEELDAYQSTLRHNRPCIVAVNKMDTPNAVRLLEEFKEEATEFAGSMKIIPVSATEEQNLGALLSALRVSVEETRGASHEAAREEFANHLLKPSKEALAHFREEAKLASFRREGDE